jgi:ribonucleoside-diphosphate reductase alpha chain
LSEKDKKALSEITVFGKYAKFLPSKGRRENYDEIVTRNKEMHQWKYPQLHDQIEQVYKDYVHTKRVLPSMRSLQFGGRPIELAHNRIFNCAYMPAEDYHFFPELMFLLLGGTGMGYSVQSHHVSKLPPVTEPKSRDYHKFQVQDSIVGWADAIKVVAKAFLCGGALPAFDYRDIREKGSELVTTGGQAPGPAPLKLCVESLTELFTGAVGRPLRPIEVHDAACIIADAVLAGGIRRAAMISLFDLDDEEMITCKSGNWWETHPYRARSNNSAVLIRGEVTVDQFVKLMSRVEASGCGEPGVYWNNNRDWGTNPCCEIALEPYQACNLTELDASVIRSQADYNGASHAAAFIGTLQAGYTDFHYLNPKWRETCERGALLGVSMTGIASKTVTELDMKQAAKVAVQTNRNVAKDIGINPAERVTTVKPAGTTSLVLGCSSGIHAWHNDYYIRRMRAGKDEELAQYMMKVAPALVEQDVMVSHQVVLSFPQKAPDGACVRTESIFDLLSRVKKVSQEWVGTGHNKGDNRHNVSCTISVKDNEWEELTNWMWINREHYNGISVLPYFGAEAYPQLPFEDCTKEVYESMLPHLEAINIDEVFEQDGSQINLAAESACSSGACEVTFL